MTDSLATDARRKENSEIATLFVRRGRACFQYPVDGPNEIDIAIDSAIEQVFGPSALSDYAEWVQKLRRNGLIT
jgi:hypothetical protein